MKLCPTCTSQYPDDANFCPQETCATPDGPQRLILQPVVPPSGRFQIGEQVGGNRTGFVHRALDTKTGTQVAVKYVSNHVIPTPALFARADREFKQLIRVASPKIVGIVDCSKTANGQLAVAMEYCDGESLEKRLLQGAVDFETAKSIVLQVGQALLEAQKAGLVHRDISPKNILLSPSGDAKVINFPIAKPINDKVSGFAGYLSPEQIQGKPIDQRSNTYSLAALLYHLATGELPFQASSEGAILEMHLSSPVLPPSQRRPASFLPADLDKLIAKAMDKSSSRRHLTLRLFLTELESLKPTIPVSAETKATEQPALAKTMMFGGNQADVARLVAEAKAAKAVELSTRSTPVEPPHSLPSAPPPTSEASVTRNTPGTTGHAAAFKQPTAVQPNIASMPTIAQQAPAQTPVSPESFESLPETPPPQKQASAPVASTIPTSRQNPVAAPPDPIPAPIRPAEAGNAPPPKAGAAFRETLWFKKGDVEQMVADAKAKMQNQGKPGGEQAPEIAEDVRPLEDRYVDDGSVTVEDRKKFSLRTGGTATALPSVSTSVPGEKIDERQIVGEIGTGRRTLILVVAVAIILALIVVVAMMLKGKGESSVSHDVKTESPKVATPTAAAPTITKPDQPDPAPAAKPAETATLPVAVKEADSQKDSEDEKGDQKNNANKKKVAKKKARQR